ncbi:nucleoside diphosphate kinase Ndk1 [Blastocladiella emersonii ATCC 22665]|nr:nucleoside diphosphate kinase Ndk1 [Blastocladiella emersonii ATCC 22665]
MFTAARLTARRSQTALRNAWKASSRSIVTESPAAAAGFTARRAFATGALAVAGLALGAVYNSTSPVEAAAAKAPIAGVKGTPSERTFIAVKPDGVQRGLVGEIIKRFEARGYKLVGLKLLVPSRALAEEHYADLKTRPFFNGLVSYMTGGQAPVVAMVWQGTDVVRQGRRLIGATNPLDAEPGYAYSLVYPRIPIRADYCISIGRNIIHGSDSAESAEKEISLWFGEAGLFHWKQANEEWIVSAN